MSESHNEPGNPDHVPPNHLSPPEQAGSEGRPSLAVPAGQAVGDPGAARSASLPRQRPRIIALPVTAVGSFVVIASVVGAAGYFAVQADNQAKEARAAEALAAAERRRADDLSRKEVAARR